jgi:hypothetical protein
MSVSGLERLAKYGQNEIEELKDNFAKMKRELEVAYKYLILSIFYRNNERLPI